MLFYFDSNKCSITTNSIPFIQIAPTHYHFNDFHLLIIHSKLWIDKTKNIYLIMINRFCKKLHFAKIHNV
ncbi:hypothetical protein BpHYR1_008626 [Brachionus plicatilis]|uniref:Uncharacterized protein n=1 Tax=Brachionus plicatilis TaxID=10195 RepID=A0A3M7S930_BRAPC|nr:hypothetical protein BpHYR1_008626 [Brachionus plicatilis]